MFDVLRVLNEVGMRVNVRARPTGLAVGELEAPPRACADAEGVEPGPQG